MKEQQTWIVITTINPPTNAILAFAEIANQRGWHLLVVGDTKTPADWNCENVEYLSIEKQHELYGTFSTMIPVKHYCRKNIGYLHAIKNGADIIIDTDDDNLPYDFFGKGITPNIKGEVVGGARWANIYSYYTDRLIWPRGLSLEYIHEKGKVGGIVERKALIQQFLADSDPDVDAIYRLLFKEPLTFEKTEAKFFIEPGTYVPFNSQNTVFFKEAFPLLYLPCHVSFRMTDIWRAFVAQRLLREMGSQLLFGSATVWQERNKHSLIKDFSDEVVGYLQNDTIIDALESLSFKEGSIESKIRQAWQALHAISIVNDDELKIVDNWLNYFK